jgi:hypothetical protein
LLALNDAKFALPKLLILKGIGKPNRGTDAKLAPQVDKTTNESEVEMP